MKLSILILLFICSFFYSNAQRCSIENEHLVANIDLNLNDPDSLYAKVEVDLANKPESLFIISKESACYIAIENDNLHIYIGWDQQSTSNLPLNLGEVINKGAKAKYLITTKKNEHLKISTISIHVNYLLYNDYLIDLKKRKKDVLIIGKNQMMLTDYFIKMKWQSFSFSLG